MHLFYTIINSRVYEHTSSTELITKGEWVTYTAKYGCVEDISVHEIFFTRLDALLELEGRLMTKAASLQDDLIIAAEDIEQAGGESQQY